MFRACVPGTDVWIIETVFSSLCSCEIGYKSGLKFDSSSTLEGKKHTHTYTHTKVSNLREPGNHQIDVGAGQWLSHGGSGPAQSAQKKRAFTANTFPAPFRVSSNYPCPVLSHKPEYYPKEMVFREQWTGTVWRFFFFFLISQLNRLINRRATLVIVIKTQVASPLLK